ncbi:MAG: response regulator receiver protein [Nitrosomonadales bacterium]|nr:MAG: response regulator receiver protein [Nitrosomonadales bacterium]
MKMNDPVYMNNAEVNVLVLSLSPDFVEKVRSALATEKTVRVGSSEGGITSIASLLADHLPDVLVVHDLGHEEGSFEIISHFVLRYPGVGVVLACPDKDPDMMVQALRSGVKEFLFEPFQTAEIRAVVHRLGAARRQQSLPSGARGEIMAFLPCKGGSGATFLATNLAHVLAGEAHKKVFFLDLNLQFGDAHLFLMDHVPVTTLAEVCASANRLDGSFLDSAAAKLPSGLRLLAAPKNPEDADKVKAEHIERILAIARLLYDFVVVDVGRSLDAVALKALDMADHIYPVLQLNLPYLRDAKRIKDLFRSLGYSENKIRWVVNRLGGREEIGLGDAKRVLDEAYWSVPNDHKHVISSVNQGVPVVQLSRHSPVSKSLLGLAHELVPKEKAKGGFISRWLHLSHEANESK